MNNEPVAWMTKDDFENNRWTIAKVRYEKKYDYSIPLYLHPAKTLTDEEILNICWQKGITWWKLSDGDMDEQTMIEFARAILRKASEK